MAKLRLYFQTSKLLKIFFLPFPCQHQINPPPPASRVHIFLALYHIFNRILANKKCIALQISSDFRYFLQCAAFFTFFTKNFVTKYFGYNWIRTSAPAYVEQSFQPIYHPSRFIVEIHLNIFIYRYFNSVTDTPENGNIHHAITHDLAPSLTIFAPPGIACRH